MLYCINLYPKKNTPIATKNIPTYKSNLYRNNFWSVIGCVCDGKCVDKGDWVIGCVSNGNCVHKGDWVIGCVCDGNCVDKGDWVIGSVTDFVSLNYIFKNIIILILLFSKKL